MNNIIMERTMIGLTVISAIIIPGSGHVILGRPVRGFLMILWMFALGYITYHLTSAGISLVGRLFGGFAVWTFSIIEVHNLARKRWKIKSVNAP